MTNSPGGIQTTGDVTIYNTPPARVLSAEKRDELITKLKPLAGSTLFIVRVGDPEAFQFATQITEAFQRAGWTVQIADVGSGNYAVGGGPNANAGVYIGSMNPNELPPLSSRVVSELGNAGVEVTPIMLPMIGPGSFWSKVTFDKGVVIRVGPRP